MRNRTDAARAHAACAFLLFCALFAAAIGLPQPAHAGEGGTSHIMPGANATLVDLPPTSPGGFVKPMYIHYSGDASAKVPTAAGVVANLNADANTLVLGGGYGFEQTVLGGAHYSVAAFLPYTWLSISGNSAGAGRRRDPERRVRPRRPDPGAGAAGLEGRLLAVRLPDADLRADGQLSRPADWATPG